MPPGPTASWTSRRSGARAEESKKTAAARAAAAAKVNDRFAEPLERLETTLTLLRRVEALARERAWEPLYDLLTPYVLGAEPMPGFKGMKARLAAPASRRSGPGRGRLPACLRRSWT